MGRRGWQVRKDQVVVCAMNMIKTRWSMVELGCLSGQVRVGLRERDA